MSLDLQGIANKVLEIRDMILEYDVSERAKKELQELREEAAAEGGGGNFIAPTPDGFRIGEQHFQKLGVHIRDWKKYWHRWVGNKKEIIEDPTPKDIAKKNLKPGCDLQLQVLLPTDAVGTYTLSLAPTSYYNFRAYVDSLGHMGLEPHKVLTVLGFRMKQYDEGNPVALVQFQYAPFDSQEAGAATGTIPTEWQ